MKNLILALSMAAMFSGLSGCASSNITHAQDRAQHQAYLEDLYTNYDAEYISDCVTYQELMCEFE